MLTLLKRKALQSSPAYENRDSKSDCLTSIPSKSQLFFWGGGGWEGGCGGGDNLLLQENERQRYLNSTFKFTLQDATQYYGRQFDK